jgi:hypothetical protein
MCINIFANFCECIFLDEHSTLLSNIYDIRLKYKNHKSDGNKKPWHYEETTTTSMPVTIWCIADVCSKPGIIKTKLILDHVANDNIEILLLHHFS